MKASALKSDAVLLLAAAIWGFAFAAQRAGMEHVGPFTFNAVRFALGSLVLVPLVTRRRNRQFKPAASPNTDTPQPAHARGVLLGSALAGSVLFLGASFQQIGIVYTTAGKAGFITGLYVIIVPVLGLLWRQRPGAGTWIGAVCAVGGLYLLSVTGRFAISKGDLLVLCSAFCWATHVLIIGRLSPRIPSVTLACLQFATCSLLSWFATLLAETVSLQKILDAAIPILYAGLMSTGVAYTLQVVAQRTAPPAHAAVILSLEAVFAVIGGWLLLGEILSTRAQMGCVLMFAGMLLSRAGFGGRESS